jgi:hypothetical protein
MHLNFTTQNQKTKDKVFTAKLFKMKFSCTKEIKMKFELAIKKMKNYTM